MLRVLITEAHEGLGLALVKEYLADAENQVVAFCGDSAKRDDLNALQANVGENQLLVVDVTLADEESIKASVEPIEGFVDALDLLIFNRGFVPEEFANLNDDLPVDVFKSYIDKLKSPQFLAKHLLDLLEQGINPVCVGMSPYY